MTAFQESDFNDALKTPAAQKFLGVCELTMIRWRKHRLYGGGPACLKIGRDYFYPRKALAEFKKQRDIKRKEAKRKGRFPRRNKFQERLRAALATQS